jgi:ketosteroid isomerase-like protein
MSRENVELVRRFEKAWAKRDLEAVLECLHDEVEFDWSDSMGPLVGTYRGRDGFTRFWNAMMDAWEQFTPETVEVLDSGPERVVTFDLVRARGRQSGIEMESHGGMVWTMREGAIVRAKMFQTKEEALKAVGLEGAA